MMLGCCLGVAAAASVVPRVPSKKDRLFTYERPRIEEFAVAHHRSGYITNAAKAHVAGGAIGCVGGPSSDAVAVAVGAMTQVRAAANDARGATVRSHGVRASAKDMKAGMKPIGAPFPNVAGDTIEAVSVGLEGGDGRSRREAIVSGVVRGELALPDVA